MTEAREAPRQKPIPYAGAPLILAVLFALPTFDIPNILSGCGCCCFPVLVHGERTYVEDPFRLGGYEIQEFQVGMNDSVEVYRSLPWGFPRFLALAPAENEAFIRNVSLHPTKDGLRIDWSDGRSTFTDEQLRIWRWWDAIDALLFLAIAWVCSIVDRRARRQTASTSRTSGMTS